LVSFALPLRVQAQAARVQAVVDSVARAALARDVMAGMVVVAVRGRDTLIMRAYGRAEVENAVPMTVQHVFQYASITKQFTAAAVLKLVEAGHIALDAPITQYLPDAPVQGQTITVRQLLAHTAGIADYAESPRIATIKRLDFTPDSLAALVAATPFYFTPGEQMRYSNTGFLLAGQLITRVSGKPYAEYVVDQVLRPAGAVHARFCNPRALVRHLARGYAATPDGLRPADFISPHAPFAAGGFCGTAYDLAAWNAEVHGRQGGRVLSKTSYAELTRVATLRGGRQTRYGLGVGVSDVAGRRALHHGGDIDGFTTFTAYLPDDSLNVTVLINTQGPTRPDAVAALVVEAALGARPLKAAGSPPRDLSMFAGKYGDDVEFEVVMDGAVRTLRMKRGPMPPMLLRYSGRDGSAWTFTDGRARYSFEPPASRNSGSPAVWADLGVALVRWERNRP
jgi:CubicO group peptidase (beta-lactamase class C family)